MNRLLQLMLVFFITFATTSSFASPWLYRMVKKASNTPRRTPEWTRRWNRIERYIIKNPTANIDLQIDGMPSARVLIRFFNPELYKRHYAGILAYDRVRNLGVGHFGTVQLAQYRPTGELVAVKTLSRKQYEEDGLSFPPREVRLMEGLDHPNVVRLVRQIRNEAALFLITEYVNGEELFRYVYKRRRLSEDESRRIMHQIAGALAYLHGKGIAHRDLKLENIMISPAGNVKIIDLGLGNFCGPHTLLNTHCGSQDYASPEIYGLRAYNGHAADVWSLGVILYVLVSGFLPFDHVKDVVSISYGWPKYVRFSDELKDLLKKIFQPAHERISIKGILEHPWMR